MLQRNRQHVTRKVATFRRSRHLKTAWRVANLMCVSNSWNVANDTTNEQTAVTNFLVTSRQHVSELLRVSWRQVTNLSRGRLRRNWSPLEFSLQQAQYQRRCVTSTAAPCVCVGVHETSDVSPAASPGGVDVTSPPPPTTCSHTCHRHCRPSPAQPL